MEVRLLLASEQETGGVTWGPNPITPLAPYEFARGAAYHTSKQTENGLLVTLLSASDRGRHRWIKLYIYVCAYVCMCV